MDRQPMRELLADSLCREGEHDLAARVRNGVDNSGGGSAGMHALMRMAEAMQELLSGHDNLYVAHFGAGMDPKDDIAAKTARKLLGYQGEL